MPEEAAESIDISNKISSVRRQFFWVLGLFATIIALLISLTIFVLAEQNLVYLGELTSAIRIIQYLYPDEYSQSRMIGTAQEALFKDLDRYSSYLEPQRLNLVTEEFTGSYSGIGVTIVSHTGGMMVISVREGGPAFKAGVMSGDVIIKADSIDLSDKNVFEASLYLRGPEDSEFLLTVARNDMADTLSMNIIRAKMKLKHVPFAGLTEKGALYIRLIDFDTGAADEVEQILDSVLYQADEKVSGIILDLQNNPGGLLNEAIQLADLFLDNGRLIVGVKGRSRWHKMEYESSGYDITDGLPLTILIDRGSASASEIVAGALKYADRALLIGDTTFGKGLVQEYKGLFDGSGIRLTTSRYYFEGEKYINDPGAEVIDSAGGIAPDYYEPEIRNPFIIALNRSLLMHQYASNNRNRILAGPLLMQSSEAWYDDFTQYCYDHDFDYQSESTRSIAVMKEIAEFTEANQKTIAMVDDFHDYSQNIDHNQFRMCREKIIRRLFRTAIELEYGASRAYREAMLPFSHQVERAEMVIDSINTSNSPYP